MTPLHSRRVASCPVQPRACHRDRSGFFIQFQWHEANVLDNWQLVVLPQSRCREFDTHRVNDNSSVPLWVYMRFSVPGHQNKPTNIFMNSKCTSCYLTTNFIRYEAHLYSICTTCKLTPQIAKRLGLTMISHRFNI